ncbi:SDR family NAD(P)-dependent oxidoreductase [Shimia ponticola]|uniref:SDR family NAD(P)-dependent oxidoreductase n=1 Tax=Shimia ponticola TaxID=2582893 RepID=UPI0011BE70DB|nr:SDR family oxidoreductase [Shimia ponticola]
MTHLAGKTALVTGGGTGIGLAIAKALASEGARVAITGRRIEVLEQAASDHGFIPIQMDVADEESVTAGFNQIGTTDILIANAGIAEGQNILKSDTAFWRQIMTTNLDGAYFTIREGLRRMPIDDWGRVIAISSIAGLRGLKGAHAYAASKHGVVGLIKTLAMDFAKRPVTFNAICPAYVETDIITRNQAKIEERTGMDADAARKVMTDLNPHGTLISPDEIAQAVLWLCGPASQSTNGATIEISGAPT